MGALFLGAVASTSSLAQPLNPAAISYLPVGCGVREIMAFDIYRIELTVHKENPTLAAMWDDATPARMRINIAPDITLPDEPPTSWVSRLEPGISAEDMEAFETIFARIDAGDTMVIDFYPGHGTRISLNTVNVLQRDGKDLFQTLLNLWLGKDPISDSLKQAILKDSDDCTFG